MELALDATQAALADALQGLPYGWLRLETWAPGDGWTRYRLACCTDGCCGEPRAGGSYRELGPYLRRSAMLDTLHVLRALAQEVSRLRREQITQARGEETR